MAKKPITTEGIEAMSSTTGLIMRARPGEAISARYTAVIIPSGTAIRPDKRVTYTDPRISGKIPKLAGSSVGYHCVPKIKSMNDTCLKTGRPSFNRKTMISNNDVMPKSALAAKIQCTPLSVY